MIIIGDFNTTVRKALADIDPNFESYKGLLVCGTHDPKNAQEAIELIKEHRQTKSPVLGICFGMQLMAIEYARNVMGIKDATSEEIGEAGTLVVKKNKNGLHVGIDRADGRMESFWNNFHVDYAGLDWGDMVFSYQSAGGAVGPGGFDIEPHRPSLIEGPIEIYLRKQYYKGVQYHPEYQSSAKRPHPVLVEFLNICKSV